MRSTPMAAGSAVKVESMVPSGVATVSAALACLSAQVALAHDAAHYAFGAPGTAAEVTRTVAVTADDRDGMRFVMDLATIRQGEVIRFVVSNLGALDHEFSIGDAASQAAHAMAMAGQMDMRHEHDPTAIRLAPGDTQELIWKFDRPVDGDLVFACQIPGHYDAGMVHRATLVSGGAKAAAGAKG